MPVDDGNSPTLPKSATTPEGFVPAGWRIEKKLEGDLDQDGDADLVLVLRKTSPRNIVSIDADGCLVPFDTNPRMFVVAFHKRSPDSYSLAVASHTLIPREGLPVPDSNLINAWDPLKDVLIARGNIMLTLDYGAERDWNTITETFTFRYRDKCFQEIGYDSRESDTKSDISFTSINFLTGKKKEWGTASDNSYLRWTTLPKKALKCIDEF
ncbi:hypothetical protein GCM10007863_37180 [Dyella mobilis]|nr:hypothetical protein GCM10007863_37180 [Dyella mobilis]